MTLDPGRVKRGLRPNMEMGTALQAGKKFRLVVSEGWKNIDGMRTSQSFVKAFTCVAADRTSPDPRNWEVTVPSSPGAALVVKTGEPLDAVLLPSSFVVIDQLGHTVAGAFTMIGNEGGIMFQPDGAWRAGEFNLHINPLLEDVSGNNLNRLFDRDVSVEGQRDLQSRKSYVIPFSIPTQ
jgi:hypothetical protein